LPEQLSVFDMVANASPLVILVLAVLALVSLISWVMIFQRWIFLRRATAEADEFEDHFWSGIDLRELHRELDSEEVLTGIETIFVAGFKEYSRLSEQSGADAESIMQGVQRSMRVALNREEEKLETHLAFLATVGSTSPYIGLFGTVWGIMNTFRSLANMTQATLATVAPGISEALIATAMGLFAAIPAVIGYNRFSARVEILLKRYDTFTEEFTTILYRAAHAKR
jgi:biopolymer transport protein TolQ